MPPWIPGRLATPRTSGRWSSSLPSDPIVLFRRWLEEAERAGIRLPNAIALATASATDAPRSATSCSAGSRTRGSSSTRTTGAARGTELGENPRAAFSVYWRELDRQISVTGDVPRLRRGVRGYFATRPREARLGAWASRQSAELASRDELMERFAAFDAVSGEDVPRPSFWGGYRSRRCRSSSGRDGGTAPRPVPLRARGRRWTIRRLSP